MKKSTETDVIKTVSFDFQESVKDLFAILENLYIDVEKIKAVLKNKNIIIE